VLPTNKAKGNDLAREIGELASAKQWKVESLHHVEGRLDDMFRSLTRSDVPT
jgi:hypothetical protein